jgi:predicted permease
MRIPLRAGRWFDATDMERGRVVVVDETFAQRYFPGGNAVGQRMVINAPPPLNEEGWLQIVGMVGNVRHNGAEDKSAQPFAYLPLGQMRFHGSLSVLLRTERPIAEVVHQLRETVKAIDPELPIYRAGSIDDVVATSSSNRRGIMLLLASLAAIALILSAVGIYGVLAYDVSQRTREIGIRGALGATRGQLAGMIVRQGLWKTAIGVSAGLAGAAALSRFLTSLLFEVRPIDPVVYATVPVLLGVVAAAACWLPARRAANVDPVVALRAE